MANTRPNIWQIQARRDIEGLVAALDYPDPEVRKRAAVALRVLDATQAVPALHAALRNETDPQVQADLSATLHVLDQHTDLNSLVSLNDVDGLIRVLKSRNPDNAIAAAQALGRLGNRLAVEPLVMLFQNTSALPRVRLAAAEALLDLQSAPAVVTLLGALKRESWQVRRNAAAVLGQIQAMWAVEPLAVALDDEQPVVRRTAAAALRRIGTADAIAALRSHFGEDKSTELQPAKKAAPSRTKQVQASPSPRPAVSLPAPRPKPEPKPERASVPASPIEPVFRQDNSPPVRQPAEPASRSMDTKPLSPIKESELAPAKPPEPVSERASVLTQPVMKLIAFLKKRTADTA